MIKKYFLFLGLLVFPFIIIAQTIKLPPKREFRGVWVATVQNIDWPARPKPGINAKEQQEELLQILDEHQKTGINAIMLQIRPTADAFYAKSREPWSMYLTGKQGRAPEPFYDPLAFAIAEAHKRGMELHAWFNPYRATNNLIDSLISDRHITRTRPEWFFTYAGKKYFNPGLPAVRQYIVQVVMDVVRQYDIDGVHFDDYFYPYPTKELLPDSAAYAMYGKNFPDINDWRRHNVDTLIHTLADSIHAAKSFVKFGISPFGIWRNWAQDPAGSYTNGLSGYSALFADARQWLQKGWLDYINPQIYFPFKYPAAAFEILTDWWSLNSYGKHLYIGQAAYRATEDREGWRDRGQLPSQVRYLRESAGVKGSVFFSSKSLTNNLAGFQDSLRQTYYRYPALPPPMPWLDAVPPPAPMAVKVNKFQLFGFFKRAKLKWQASAETSAGGPVYGYVIYRFKKADPINLQNPQHILKISYDKFLTTYTDKEVASRETYTYVVTTLDRLKNESAPSKNLVAKFNKFF